jgi:phosphatidate cytidylyltransferase
MNTVYLILAVYFAIGALLTWLIGRKKMVASKIQSWTKYGLYLGIVTGIMASMQFYNGLYFNYLAQFILLVCIGELILASYKSNRYIVGIWSMLPFLLLAFGFYSFSFLSNPHLIYTWVLTVVFDGFSQLTGQLLGKKTLVPGISPNKTRAGLYGGVAATVLTSLLIRDLLHLDFLGASVLGLIMAFSAFWGDLGASFLKRRFGIKDYSKLIPGHGGMLDRFDSFLATGAVMYLLHLVWDLANG